MSVAIVAGEGTVSDAISLELESLGLRVERLGDADVADRGRAIAAAKRIGAASVLVTCPSLYDQARFGEMPPERWRRLLHAHLGATTNACAAVVPMMVEAGRGVVVTTSSWLAYAGVAGESYQAAATGSVLAFTKSFALEVAPKGVRVNCIALGDVPPSDVAGTVRFLVEDGDFFVGQVLVAAAGKVV